MLLISGLYDTDTMQRDEYFRSDSGNDDAKLKNVSFLDALASTAVPLFVAVAVWDPLHFQNQFVRCSERSFAADFPCRASCSSPGTIISRR